MTDSTDNIKRTSVGIGDLPLDELILYGESLGLRLERQMGPGELLRRVRDRQELLLELSREAMLDIVVWARRPVRESASKEELAQQIASIEKMEMNGLSDRGVKALARLRGLPISTAQPRELIEANLKDAEPWRNRWRRYRRKMVGSVVSKIVKDGTEDPSGAYHFLPEDDRPLTVKRRIAEQGVVGGIANKLKGVADDYVREKLDEIEARIDHKLDEIDRRLGEWRDKEIANRLKIIKITVAASVVVALLSLAYNCMNTPAEPTEPPPPQETGAVGQKTPDPSDACGLWSANGMVG